MGTEIAARLNRHLLEKTGRRDEDSPRARPPTQTSCQANKSNEPQRKGSNSDGLLMKRVSNLNCAASQPMAETASTIPQPRRRASASNNGVTPNRMM